MYGNINDTNYITLNNSQWLPHKLIEYFSSNIIINYYVF